MGEGPDLDFVLHLGAFEHAGPDDAVAADYRVDDLAARPDPRPLADPGAAAQDDAGLQDDVLGQLHRGVHVRPDGIDERHAGQHVALVDDHAHLELGRGQLRAVVDAGERAVVLDLQRHDAAGDRRGPARPAPAGRTRPETGEGFTSPIRRRSQAASKA